MRNLRRHLVEGGEVQGADQGVSVDCAAGVTQRGCGAAGDLQFLPVRVRVSDGGIEAIGGGQAEKGEERGWQGVRAWWFALTTPALTPAG